MPLSFMKAGEKSTVKRITGQDDTKKFLESLGFICGATVTVISEISGNMILNVKDSRIALDKNMASRIMV